MMNLDEAIAHALERAEGCDECAEEHRQLATWLTELRDIRANRTVLTVHAGPEPTSPEARVDVGTTPDANTWTVCAYGGATLLEMAAVLGLASGQVVAGQEGLSADAKWREATDCAAAYGRAVLRQLRAAAADA